MRKQIWIACAVVLAICVFLLLRKPMQQQKTAALPEQSVTATNQSSRTEESKPVDSRQVSIIATTTVVPPVAAASMSSAEDTNVINPRLLAAWQAPIEFYGKVLDENSNTVARAKVGFFWVEIPREDGNRTTNTESDLEGLFSLRGERGLSLTVSVGKEGYYTSRSDNDSFSYGALEGIRFSADPQNPVVFHLRKKGTPEPLIRLAGTMGGARDYRLDVKGLPTDLSFYTGKRASQGESQFRVEYKMEVPQDSKQRQFNWQCRITIPGGGLQIAPKEFPFTAPTDDYQETIEINSGIKPESWSDRFEQSYYFRLPDGKFGRLEFNLICSTRPFFGVEVLINPSGSRNLEYDKYLPGNTMVNQSSP